MNSGSVKFCPICGTELGLKIVEDRKRAVCSTCGWINYENPLPCAAALVRGSVGGILLVKRGVEPGKGEWALPSGFIEVDETPEEACIRELKEETGLEGRIVRLVGVYSQESLKYKNVLIAGYEVEASGIPYPGSDSESVRFFSPSELPLIAFPSHLKMIKDGIESQDR
jgi:ADP-ribose pyrophosphatase YjhB (NUDIX family)